MMFTSRHVRTAIYLNIIFGEAFGENLRQDNVHTAMQGKINVLGTVLVPE